MNLKELRDMAGAVVIFRPRPKINGNYLKEAYNFWIMISEVAEKQFLFKNTISNHEFTLGIDNIDQFRSPSFLILRGQMTLQDGGKVNFEPFAQGIAEDNLVDHGSLSKSNPVYDALKPHEGKEVTLRFPDKGDWKYGTVDAVLDACTTNFITVRRPALTLQYPDWMVALVHKSNSDIPTGSMSERLIPEKVASIPLAFVSVAEDVDNKRPMIVFDHSFWEGEAT